MEIAMRHALRPTFVTLIRWLTAVAAAAALAPAAVQAASFDQVVVFGDSLSDVGIAYKLTNGAIPASPPYYNGRFSNGPVAVEWLAAGLHVPLLDLAVGGARTDTTNVVPAPIPTGVQAQVGWYTGAVGPGAANPSALYVVWAGANDFDPAAANPATLAVQAVADNLQSIAALYQFGARSFLVPNLPDLSLTPRYLAQQTSDPTAVANARTFSDTFAAATTLALSQASSALGGATFYTTPVLQLSRAVFANPEPLGFTNVSDACLDNGVVCASPDTYLSWDGWHPTAHAHELLGAAFVASVVPEPSDAVLLGAGFALIVWVRFRNLRRR